MNDKINGIIVNGRIYINDLKVGRCADCDLYNACNDLWNVESEQYCDIIDSYDSHPYKFSQELTDKLNGQTDTVGQQDAGSKDDASLP